MSEEDGTVILGKKESIHYGSLEEGERQRISASSLPKSENDDRPNDSGKDSEIKPQGNIHVSDEYMDIEDEMAKDKQSLLEEFERRKKARQVNVSTDDAEVRQTLRQLGEPICLFGEGPAERRARLRDLLSRLGEDAIQKKQEEEEERKLHDKDPETTWFHEGPDGLIQARWWIARYSLPRARDRLVRAREEVNRADAKITAKKQEMQKRLTSLTIHCSQIGDTRPVSYCSFSPDSKMLVTSSWSGLCKLWSVPSCEPIRTLRGHNCNVTCVMFHPQACQPNALCAMASCAVDGSVKLWNLESEEPIADFEGHAPHRVSRLDFHPSGRFMATCCFDHSWRLWDLEKATEVLHQEGHSAPVHCISFQCDGSVAATGGLDAYGRLWDLRTGRCVMIMEGHLKAIYGMDFSPDGFHIATGSDDNCVKIWDIRKQSCIYTVPAHNNLISHVKFQPFDGDFMLTCSYDNTAKVWSNRTWQPLKTLSGHDSKIMCLDISPDSQYIATSSFDRTFKLWYPEEIL